MAGIDANTVLMLHCDADFTDSETQGPAKTPTVTGATIDGTVKKFGAGSGAFVKASSQIVTYATSTDFDFGSGSFTIDCWFNCATLPANGVFHGITGRLDSSAFEGFQIYITRTAGTLQIRAEGFHLGSPIGSSGLVTLSINAAEWHHLAFVRNGTNWSLYIDGTSISSVTDATGIGSAAAKLGVGARNIEGAPDLYFDGNIDEFRISKGIARWTANFTPPTAPYDSSTGAGGMNLTSFYWKGQ